jgi:hypothetical protein
LAFENEDQRVNWAVSSNLIGYPRIFGDLWGVLIAEAIRGSKRIKREGKL